MYRVHAETPRSRQVRLRFTEAELVAVTDAANRAGLTPSGYAAEAAVAAALQLASPSLAPWREALAEFISTRSQLRRMGSNLNQAARVLNVEGEAPVWLERACALVERCIARVDETADRVHRLARASPTQRRNP